MAPAHRPDSLPLLAWRPPLHLVVMGVAGCGKSEVGRRLADALDLPLIEGDEFHPAANIEKMRNGEPLGDADRAGWLVALRDQIRSHAHGVVLTCSALKQRYRDVLREGAPQLLFIHLKITQAESLRRVAARPGHFYPPALVASQFEALEDPSGEAGVISVDATLPIDELVASLIPCLRFNYP